VTAASQRHRGDSVTVYTCPWCGKTGRRRGLSQPVIRRCGHCLRSAKLVGGEYRRLIVE